MNIQYEKIIQEGFLRRSLNQYKEEGQRDLNANDLLFILQDRSSCVCDLSWLVVWFGHRQGT